MRYAELHCRTYFSFLEAASAPEDLVERAHALGYRTLAVTDVDGVYGAPRAHHAAKALGLPIIIGAEVTVAETEADAGRAGRPAGRIVLLALDEKGYGRMCRLITLGRRRHAKGRACVTWDEMAQDTRGLIALTGGASGPMDRALATQDLATARRWAGRLLEAFGDRAYLELTHHLRPGDDARIEAAARITRELRMPRVVTQDARYATAAKQHLHDVLSCIKHKTTLVMAGRRLEANGEGHLGEVSELERRFAGLSDALERTLEVADRCRFSLEELRYRFPAFPLPEGETSFSYLHDLVMAGARERYRPMTAKVLAQLAHELGVIERMRLAGYFLIVWDLVRFCRERGVLCQGRGSAANSAVCYALGITAVDPVGMNLLFERFLSEERQELPDIDIDIAHKRREEVIQYVYARYGRERVAMANEVITYRMRSALRDVGKVFGLSLAQVDAAAKAYERFEPDGRVLMPSWGEMPPDQMMIGAGLNPEDRTIQKLYAAARGIVGFPRHLGIHSGGMVITQGPMAEVCPVEPCTMPGRTVVQWDKDDLNQLGIIKIDLLGLGMLTVIDGALRLVQEHEGLRLDLAQLPPDDPETYAMMARADTVGVFQIESRAQMSMLPRLEPRTFYDLVIEVAIIRPGPIQGEMVHPYLRRRNGTEPVTYPHPSLEPVLRRTLGIPLFQEQGMRLAIVAAGFTPGEADELRRAMGHKRSRERMAALVDRLRSGMERNGITTEAAERIIKELTAFADYGFPESHAASFALLVVASAYLKRHHPAAFLAALLNAQPMGFYSSQTLISDAQRHGVKVRSVCARRSAWDATLEPDGRSGKPAVRLGMSALRGIGEVTRAAFAAARAQAPFRSVGDFARRSGLGREALQKLAAAGGFEGFGLSRREALWHVAALPRTPTPLLGESEYVLSDRAPGLVAMTVAETMTADYAGLGLSIEHNPLTQARQALDAAGAWRAADLLMRARHGQDLAVAGVVIVRQRPATAKGMVFITLEDETGLSNLVLTPPVYDKLRTAARNEMLLWARGRVERLGQVVNVKVSDLKPLREITGLGEAAALRSRDFH